MPVVTIEQKIAQAIKVIESNDLGTYTVPTHGLYPFQWNWDSCLVALGQAHFDEQRAWREIETLFEHQWEDGLVPHIIFHKEDEGYFPGPDIWATGRSTPTSGITQPPVAGFVVRRLFERCTDRALATKKASTLLPKIQRWHDWFFRCRDPKGTGLVAIIHPWESGRDNSIDWDKALDRIETDDVAPFSRRDTSHANPEHRPTDEQYKRYIKLIQIFRSLNWDNSTLHDASPFQIVDPGFNAILQRSCADLHALATLLDVKSIADKSANQASLVAATMDNLWSEQLGQYTCYDRVGGEFVASASIGGILPAFAAIPTERLAAISQRIHMLAEQCAYLVPSHDPSDRRFDALRYWRGPVWLIINYLIADGLALGGYCELAKQINASSISLIEESGFAEYYSPIDATPCGGGSFTWTAAMVLEILNAPNPENNRKAG